MPGLRQDLEALTRIPSVTLDAFDQAHVEASAEATADLLRAEGLEVEIVREGGRPAVIGHARRAAGRAAPSCSTPTTTCSRPATSPTVGQPAVRADRAGRPALRPRRRRRQGRGHGPRRRAARPLRRAAGRASPSSSRARRRSAPTRWPTILERHGEKLRADAIVLADSTNWAIGEPALTTTLRGHDPGRRHRAHARPRRPLAACSAARCPTRITALVRLLASLHDDDGNVAVAGLKVGRGRRPRLRRGAAARGVRAARRRLDDRHRFAALADVDQAVDHDHRHRRPVGGDVVQHPGAAAPPRRSRCASRPTRTPMEAFALLAAHLSAHAPWGAKVEVPLDDRGRRLLRRRQRSGLRPGPRGLHRRVGRASRSTSASAARSRSSPRSPSGSPMPRSSSPASRTPTPVPTAPTSRCTWASSRRSASPRPSARTARSAARLSVLTPVGWRSGQSLVVAGQGEHLVERDPGPVRRRPGRPGSG